MDSPELQYLKTMTEASIKLATFFAKSLVDVQARLMSIASTQRTNALVQLTLENLGSAGTPVDVFRQAQETESSWSAGILSLLISEYIFDDEAIATEYQNLTIGIVREDMSLERKVSTLREIIGQKLSWLEGLIERIDEMPQSELTPTGGFF